MFYSIANSLISKLSCERIIEDSMYEVYVYGFELILSSIVNILILVAISIYLREPFAWLFFLIPFIPQRVTAGGYHASSHSKCIVVGAITFLVSLSLVGLIPNNLRSLFSIIVSLSNLVTVLLLSPVQSKNKPLTVSEVHKNRTLSIIISIIHVLCVVLILVAVQSIPRLGMVYITGVFAAGLSLAVGNTETKNRKDENHEKSS